MLIHLVLLALAVYGVSTVWHRGSLFAAPRAFLEVRGGFLADLLLCPLCLSAHLAFWLAVIGILPEYLLPAPYVGVIQTITLLTPAAVGLVALVRRVTREDGEHPGQ